MAAFRGALAVGVQAIETDVHVSRDGVVVLSHVSAPPIHDKAEMLTLEPRIPA